MKPHFLPLTPITTPWMRDLFSKPDQLQQAVQEFGSPVNILDHDAFRDNISSIKAIFDTHQINGEVFFARKANKAKSFVIAAKNAGCGVDTASANELRECIEAGMQPEKFISTAAVKTDETYLLSLAAGNVVILDNDDELAHAQRVAENSSASLNIGIRINGFIVRGQTLYTRFGFPMEQALKRIENLAQSHPNLRFKGLHFHLNGYSVEERTLALSQSLALAEKIQAKGIAVDFIDIGGGFLVNYLEREQEWTAFHQVFKNSLTDTAAPELTFRKMPLGVYVEDGKTYGEPTVYPYYNGTSAAEILDQILKGEDNAARLKNQNIQLRVEPGRALLNQAGITVARVNYRKTDMEGRLLVGLEMNRTQLMSSSADFLLDPFHLPENPLDQNKTVYGYLMGAYCLEQELILKRKIAFKQMPEVGDLVAFVNTAGYMMHFYESEAHLFDLANNVVRENEKFTLDEDFFMESLTQP